MICFQDETKGSKKDSTFHPFSPPLLLSVSQQERSLFLQHLHELLHPETSVCEDGLRDEQIIRVEGGDHPWTRSTLLLLSLLSFLSFLSSILWSEIRTERLRQKGDDSGLIFSFVSLFLGRPPEIKRDRERVSNRLLLGLCRTTQTNKTLETRFRGL